jgi:hypothetical protein
LTPWLLCGTSEENRRKSAAAFRSFRAKRLHGLDRCGATGRRHSGNEYSDHQKAHEL